MAEPIYSIMKPTYVEFRADVIPLLTGSPTLRGTDDIELVLCLEDSKLYYQYAGKFYEVGFGEITS